MGLGLRGPEGGGEEYILFWFRVGIPFHCCKSRDVDHISGSYFGWEGRASFPNLMESMGTLLRKMHIPAISRGCHTT